MVKRIFGYFILFFFGATSMVIFTFKKPEPYYSYLKSFFMPIYLVPKIKEKNFDAYKIIQIKNKDDLNQTRKNLRNFIFGGEDLSGLLPEVKKSITDERYKKLKNLKSIDKYAHTMEYGITSIAYKFNPIKNNKKLIIYSQGHAGDFYNGIKNITFFLEKGYTIIAVSLPLKGLNSKPLVESKNNGELMLDELWKLKYFRPTNGNYFRYFLEPIIAFINQASMDLPFDSISMTGISGGGWTTILMASIEERIKHSFPVAAPLPLAIRNAKSMTVMTRDSLLYQKFNYLDLYILGSTGKGRVQNQIFNYYDPCCRYGDNGKYYLSAVKNTLKTISDGEFDVIYDYKNKLHTISDFGLDFIHNRIKNN
ncbi:MULTISPECIES: hypothetical protein [Prochlorococcus]|nr:hypothetical protein [Prochlorococcus marinus]KGF99797.1 hypothetical protein EU97_1163 [Prochlorococcus marinus str. MIT 9311]